MTKKPHKFYQVLCTLYQYINSSYIFLNDFTTPLQPRSFPVGKTQNKSISAVNNIVRLICIKTRSFSTSCHD